MSNADKSSKEKKVIFPDALRKNLNRNTNKIQRSAALQKARTRKST